MYNGNLKLQSNDVKFLGGEEEEEEEEQEDKEQEKASEGGMLRERLKWKILEKPLAASLALENVTPLTKAGLCLSLTS